MRECESFVATVGAVCDSMVLDVHCASCASCLVSPLSVVWCSDPKDVDILMGTFTKSFGAMGGYIAASKEFIDYIRSNTAGFLCDNAMSPVVCQQILTSFKVLRGQDGTTIGRQKLERLRENANYFRGKLIDMGTLSLRALACALQCAELFCQI
jgi:7-keto-8-aminopelargonate synthetase-like enzyme